MQACAEAVSQRFGIEAEEGIKELRGKSVAYRLGRHGAHGWDDWVCPETATSPAGAARRYVANIYE